MPFIHPAIFWTGLAAVSLPILIHILNRRRYRVHDWAAMKFLIESLRRNRRRLRIEELILLAIRCLAVLLVAAALARFSGCESMGLLPGGDSGRRTTVFLLDDSFSMAQKHGPSRVFSAAVTDLTEWLRVQKQTDTVAVLLGASHKPREAFFGPAFVTDRESLLVRIGALKPSDRRMRLSESLAAAEEIFRDDKPGTRQLFLLGDFRKADLSNRAEADACRKRFESLRKMGVEVVAIDYGVPAGSNLTVRSISLLDEFAVANLPLRIGVTVANHGQQTVRNVPVRLSYGAREGEDSQVRLPAQTIPAIEPGQSARAEFGVVFRQSGPMVVTAQLDADELLEDNTARLALNVRSALRVLVVDGRPDAARRTDGESYFLACALDPNADGASGVRAEIVAPDALAAVGLAEYDLVALLNVAGLAPGDGAGDPPQVAALERYVAEGGGLAIFTGDRIDLNFWNGPMWKNGEGLSPYRIRAPRGDSFRQETYHRLDPRELVGEGPLRLFEGDGAQLAGLIRFFVFTPAEEAAPARSRPELGPPRVLARFTDPQNSPAVVARKYDQGTVVMFYTSAHTRWTDWPQDTPPGIFTVPVHDLVRYAARRQKERFTALVDESIVYELSPALLDAPASLRLPSYPATPMVPLRPERDETRNVLRFARTAEAGVYALSFDAPGSAAPAQQVLFARNGDPAEGNLEPGGREEITAAFGSDEFVYRHHEAGGQAGIVQAEAQKEYWIYLLTAAIALLAVETYLGQRFGHYAA